MVWSFGWSFGSGVDDALVGNVHHTSLGNDTQCHVSVTEFM